MGVGQQDAECRSAAARRDGRLARAALLLAVVSALAFAILAEAVAAGLTRDADRQILLALRRPNDRTDPLGPLWLEQMAQDVTALGGPALQGLLTLGALGGLLLRGQRRNARWMLAAIGGGLLVRGLLKLAFRPMHTTGLTLHSARVSAYSFPSGHAMMAVITFLTLAALLARAQPDRRLKWYCLTLATLLAGLVGLSRVYLGMHLPSDVLAGWLAGLAWVLACWLAWRRPRRPGGQMG